MKGSKSKTPIVLATAAALALPVINAYAARPGSQGAGNSTNTSASQQQIAAAPVATPAFGTPIINSVAVDTSAVKIDTLTHDAVMDPKVKPVAISKGLEGQIIAEQALLGSFKSASDVLSVSNDYVSNYLNSVKKANEFNVAKKGKARINENLTIQFSNAAGVSANYVVQTLGKTADFASADNLAIVDLMLEQNGIANRVVQYSDATKKYTNNFGGAGKNVTLTSPSNTVNKVNQPVIDVLTKPAIFSADITNVIYTIKTFDSAKYTELRKKAAKIEQGIKAVNEMYEAVLNGKVPAQDALTKIDKVYKLEMLGDGIKDIPKDLFDKYNTAVEQYNTTLSVAKNVARKILKETGLDKCVKYMPSVVLVAKPDTVNADNANVSVAGDVTGDGIAGVNLNVTNLTTGKTSTYHPPITEGKFTGTIPLDGAKTGDGYELTACAYGMNGALPDTNEILACAKDTTYVGKAKKQKAQPSKGWNWVKKYILGVGSIANNDVEVGVAGSVDAKPNADPNQIQGHNNIPRAGGLVKVNNIAGIPGLNASVGLDGSFTQIQSGDTMGTKVITDWQVPKDANGNYIMVPYYDTLAQRWRTRVADAVPVDKIVDDNGKYSRKQDFLRVPAHLNFWGADLYFAPQWITNYDTLKWSVFENPLPTKETEFAPDFGIGYVPAQGLSFEIYGKHVGDKTLLVTGYKAGFTQQFNGDNISGTLQLKLTRDVRNNRIGAEGNATFGFGKWMSQTARSKIGARNK